MNRHLTVVAVTDKGALRRHNEDAVLVSDWIAQTDHGSPTVFHLTPPQAMMCAVADGMGGHAAGQLASRVLLADLREHLAEFTDTDAIGAGITGAGIRLGELGRSPELTGLGTTIAGVLFKSDMIAAFNVGDSRVYQVVDGYLELVTLDDSVSGPDGHTTGILTQSLGDGAPAKPHLFELGKDFTGRLLVCSDGVTGAVERDTLRATLAMHDPLVAVTELAAAVDRGGAEDNYSIVLIVCSPPATAGAGHEPPNSTSPSHDPSTVSVT